MSKYNSKKVVVAGILFDSKAEGERYEHLKELENKGLIENLVCQPRFELVKAFKKDDKKYRKMDYVADFSYWDNRLERDIVEDVKGMPTEVAKIKRKLFDSKYYMKLIWIYKAPVYSGRKWIEHEELIKLRKERKKLKKIKEKLAQS